MYDIFWWEAFCGREMTVKKQAYKALAKGKLRVFVKVGRAFIIAIILIKTVDCRSLLVIL